jgi:HAMP domain-containing protein
VANPYSIHLVEPLSPEVALRVATETASQLGGTPDKLAQLLTRNSGSRIARASSAAQADRVANILRKAGVTVQVIDPEQAQNTVIAPSAPAEPIVPPAADQVQVAGGHFSPPQTTSSYDANAGASSVSSGGIPIVPDEIIPVDDAPYKPPLQDSTFTPDIFPATSADPFGTDNKDLFSNDPTPFSAPQSPAITPADSSNPFGNDPFAAPSSQPFNDRVGDAFSAASSRDAFAEPANLDPFAAPKNDPFAPTGNNPFAAPSGSDPFAAVAGTASPNLVEAPAFDPFAAEQNVNLASDLPPQALKAQQRATPRSSVRAQMLRGLILPVLLVGFLITVYLNYQFPITMQRFLSARANAASSIVASRLANELPNTEGVSQKALLDKINTETRNSVPNALFVAVSTTNNNNKILSNSVDTNLDATKISAALEQQASTLVNGGVLEVDGKRFVTYAVPIRNAINQTLGTTFAGMDYEVINTEKLNLFVPLFVVLILILIVAAAFATILANRLVRPIIAAADQANRISLGDLDRTVEIQSNDEIGDLLGSLERMRVSLKSVIGRLRRDR